MKKLLAIAVIGAAAMGMAMTANAADLIKVGYAQVGHESDWRTANTKNYQDTFTEDNGYSLELVDCDNDHAKQIEAVRNFIQEGLDYIIIAPIQSAG